jgi:hypothetical protein
MAVIEFNDENKQEIDFLKEFTSLNGDTNLNKSVCIEWKEFIRILYYYRLRVTCNHKNILICKNTEEEYCLTCGNKKLKLNT